MSRRRKLFKLKLRRDSLVSVAAVVLILLAVLSFLSFFAQAASSSTLLQELLNRFFGWGSITIPFILAVSGLLMLGRGLAFAKTNTLFGLVLFLISFSGISHLIFYRGPDAEGLAALGQGGGLMGYKISSWLAGAFTIIGAFSILLSILIISLLVAFNASLNRALNVTGTIISLPIRYLKSIKLPSKRNNDEPKGMSQELPLVASAPKTFKVNQQQPLGLDPASEGGVEVPKKEKLTVEVLPKKFIENKLVTPEKLKPEAKKEPAVSEEGLVQETVKNLPSEVVVWEYPPISLLSDEKGAEADRGDVSYNASVIEKTLGSFGIKSHVVEVNLGPAVTQYALESAEGTKIARIKNLQNDLAMALASPTGAVRIEAPIPGKSLIGVETPNISPSTVNLKAILSSELMTKTKSKLAIAMGLDVSGSPVVADIARMPHVLVAGSTGSGKSTLIHALLATLLFRCSPEELKLILVDTKRVELTEYNEIPHLLTPVITETEKVLAALKWCVAEMERRYKLFQNAKVRNIDSYNELSGFQALPYILILVDEMADMMQMAPVEVEKAVCRLAQMARATGIHLVLSTQRPSVDVLTGLIKANIPARIAFNVTSQIDSRVIIDQTGAEKLLGRGDMLYLPPESSKPRRIQGVYVSPKELHALIDFIKRLNVKPKYQEEVTTIKAAPGDAGFAGSEDELFSQAVEVICEMDRASASLLQRRLKVGYARAARLLDEMESRGIVGSADGSKPRDVLIHDPSQVPSSDSGLNTGGSSDVEY